MKRSAPFVAALFASSALASPAFAQEYTPPSIPPIRQTIDANGVDLTSGVWVGRTHSVSIGGPGTAGLSWSRTFLSSGSFRDSTAIILSVSGSTYTVSNGGSSESFTLSGGNFVSDQKTGSTLTLSGTTYTYTDASGTIVTLQPYAGTKPQYRGSHRVSTITYPTGEILTFNWETVEGVCVPNVHQPDGCNRVDGERLRSVTATNGYRLLFTFQLENPSTVGPSVAWASIATVVAQNMAVDPTSQSWPTLTLTGNQSTSTETIADSLSRTTTYTFSGGILSAIKRPGASSNNETFGYTGGLVSQVISNGVATNYSYSDVGTVRTTTITDAASNSRVVTSDLTTGLVTQDKDEAGNSTSYAYYPDSGLLQTVTAPEGNKADFQYDGRGNRTKVTLTQKSGDVGAIKLVSSATYPASDSAKPWLCASGTPVVVCNKPVTTTDVAVDAASPAWHVTDYTWDSATGQITSVKRPAPATGKVRPETRYHYDPKKAQYLTSGGLVDFATSVSRLTSISQCQTGEETSDPATSCIGTADESKTTVVYGVDPGLDPVTYGAANALPRAVVMAAGNGADTAITGVTYDAVGNRTSVDGPRSDVVDITAYRYDLDRELVGTISPDPDGPGTDTLPNRAVRVTYNDDGQVTKQEAGTTAGQTDGAWAAFTSLQEADTIYDANARAVTRKLRAGGVDYAVTQTSYDSLGRLDCTAVRMNPATFGSLPAACTLGTTGAFGPDRITKLAYDPVSRPTTLTEAYGVIGDEAVERTLTYSANGQVSTVKDGEKNLTHYIYDGFDRRYQIEYPTTLPQGAGTSNPSNYEEFDQDANSNVTNFRNRAGQNVVFIYDALNRVTAKAPAAEAVVNYEYDNLDRLTKAYTSSLTDEFHYDALSRKRSETSGATTLNFDVFPDGRRKSITYPGSPSGLTIDYEYLATGDLKTIKQGADALATYSYDNLGNRTGVGFFNGAGQTFNYDPVSRLSELKNDLTDSNDLDAKFYYNPASQISSSERAGDMYAYTPVATGSVGYAQNGLNQDVTIGTGTASWDTKGNLTFDPISTRTYGYSSENLLTSSSGGSSATLSYDPAMRLYQVAGSATTRFAYDGSDAIAEYDGSNTLKRRFVFDPTTGQPVLWYEGTGTSATDRRYLSQDERGSVISVSNSAGAAIGINTYDEYGVPGSANIGRFQYTGQKWIGEAGLYDYKARDYLPQHGIFAQPDPIGYAGGVNLYAYVGGDPVNLIDPLGLSAEAGPLTCDKEDNACPQTPIIITGTRTQPPPTPPVLGSPLTPVECFSGCGGGPSAGDKIVITGTRLRPQSVGIIVKSRRPAGPTLISAPSAAPTQDFCGSDGTSAVPDRVGGTDITGPCELHDECYSSQTAEHVCNHQLMIDIWAECRRQSRTLGCYVAGVIYYLGLEIAGGPAYRRAHEH